MTPDDCGVAALEVDGVDSNESMELAPAFELCFSSISKFVGGGTGTVRTWDKLDGSGAPRPSTTPAAVMLLGVCVFECLFLYRLFGCRL